MAGLTRKGLNLKIKIVTGQKVRKHLSFQPVIRKVDVAAIKEEWSKKGPKKAKLDSNPSESPKAEAVVKAKASEVKVEKVAEEKLENTSNDTPDVKSEMEAPMVAKKEAKIKEEPKAKSEKKPASKKPAEKK